jgi:hypothetical protein
VKHLGIILVDIDSDTPEAARAVVERLAQQTRHRLAIDGSAKVHGVGVELIENASAADLRASLEAQRGR